MFKTEEFISAVPPGSVPELVVFTVFRNDTGKGVRSDGTEFAGEVEVCTVVKMSTHCRLQERSHNKCLDDKMTN